MANFLSKIKIPKAVEKRHKANTSCSHITTNDFYKLKPVYFREMVGDSSINVNMSTFTRLEPLQHPYYGSAYIMNRAFFIPMRTIQEGWNELYTMAPYTNATFNGIPSHVTQVSTTVIKQFFTGNSAYATVTTADRPDFVDVITGDSYQLTNTGRYIYDILRCLGYELDWQDSTAYYLSALPILSFVKLYCDWYFNSVYQIPQRILQCFFGIDKTLVAQDLQDIFGSVLYANYEQDRFVSAWDNPVAPTSGTMKNITIVDNTVEGTGGYKSAVTTSHNSATGGSTNGTPVVLGSSNGTAFNSNSAYNFTQYIDMALHRVYDFVQRYNLVGSKAMDRYFGLFGKALSDASLRRSSYIGGNTVDINIADVVSTSDTLDPNTGLGSALGQYGGKGIAYGQNGKFSFKTDEAGYFMVVSCIIPRISYVQGIRKHCTRLTWDQFYQPSFDGLGCEPVTCGELVNDYYLQKASGNTKKMDSIFGWMPRGYDYKLGRDTVSGDFRFYSRNEGQDSFYLARLFDIETVTDTDLVHSHAFTMGNNESYDRIFNNTDGGYDHFITIFQFNVTENLPMRALFDVFDDEDKGKKQSMTIGGTRLD